MYTITSSTKGNKSLTYPIGLITADEVMMAGTIYETNGNTSFYLYNGEVYWTISPSIFSKSDAAMFVASGWGHIPATSVENQYGIRPVINLRSNTNFTFNGTGEKGSITNPYIVS